SDLPTPWAFMASASCQAITRLRATAELSSSRPSSCRNWSKSDPMRGFLAMVYLLHPAPGQLKVGSGQLLLLLDHTVQQDHRLVHRREQDSCDAIPEVGPDLPEPRPQL